MYLSPPPWLKNNHIYPWELLSLSETQQEPSSTFALLQQLLASRTAANLFVPSCTIATSSIPLQDKVLQLWGTRELCEPVSEEEFCKGMSPCALGRWLEGAMRVLAEFQINLAIPKDIYGYFSTRGEEIST